MTELRKCPHCNGKYRDVLIYQKMQLGFFDPTKAPAISRRDGENICLRCTRAEALADLTKGSLTDSMARVAIEQDFQEALRLPAGHVLRWFPTGGLDEYAEAWESVYSPENYAIGPLMDETIEGTYSDVLEARDAAVDKANDENVWAVWHVRTGHLSALVYKKSVYLPQE